MFQWLKDSHSGIVFLQETHFCKKDEKLLEKEWGGQSFVSNGTSQSRGVAIMIPKNFRYTFKLVSEKYSHDGRWLILTCEIEGIVFTFVNVYAPTRDHLALQLQFIKELKCELEEFSGTNLLLGGDFNTYLNPMLDKKGGDKTPRSEYTKLIESLMIEYNLIDIWRSRYPTDLKYTRTEKSRTGLIQSRLDYWLVSEGLSFLITSSTIKPGKRSDHSLIKIEVELTGTQVRGPRYWKFNNNLLRDNTYIKIIKEELQSIKNNCTLHNKNTLWDYTKCQMRTVTISYSILKSRKSRKREKELLKELEQLEIDIISNPEKEMDYVLHKIEWEELEKNKTEGIILRSKARWAENGEKNTKFFLNLEKRNYNRKYIKKLKTTKNIELTNPDDILNEEFNFYKTLYTLKQDGQENFSAQFLSNNEIPKLNDSEKLICDATLKIYEIAKALKELPNDKTPGSDGFTTNFYKFFWCDLKELLYDSYKFSFDIGELTNDQKRGILNLIPKEGKDLRELRNWRPVSVLNTDYKILTKALANRLQGLLPKLINEDQVGYVKGRYIGQNIRIIADMLKYTDINKIQANILLIDFEKAFDSIEWSFMFKCLEAYNLGECFIKWVKTLYKKIQSCVSNNGYLSPYFTLNRGIR